MTISQWLASVVIATTCMYKLYNNVFYNIKTLYWIFTRPTAFQQQIIESFLWFHEQLGALVLDILILLEFMFESLSSSSIKTALAKIFFRNKLCLKVKKTLYLPLMLSFKTDTAYLKEIFQYIFSCKQINISLREWVMIKFYEKCFDMVVSKCQLEKHIIVWFLLIKENTDIY